ncbi:MAG: hypothetical protein ABIZ04_06260, partial [Opitutus sp.]
CRLESAGLREAKVLSRARDLHTHTPTAQRVPSREMVRHALQLTCQFIRTVRYCLESKTSWIDALPLFQRRLQFYL